jgi:uncharacterized protein (DUF488 family)
MSEPYQLLSVGYSHHPLEDFLALLRGAGVTAVADVRTHPHSRFCPYANAPHFAETLGRAGIRYVFLGEQLGGRPAARELYDDEGRVDYELVRRTEAFRQGLERLERGVEQFIVAMLCGEEDPLDCHRGLMITPALVERGVVPGHLRRDGRVETTAEMEERLLTLTGTADGLTDGLFAGQLGAEDRRELVAEAYRRRARRVAFRLDLSGGEEG